MAIQLEKITQEFNVEAKGALAALGAVVAALTAVAGAGALAVNATFKWAGELDSIQDVMGNTSEEAAALNFVLRKSGTETEKLTSGMTILEKGLVTASGELDKTGKKLAEFGINALDANGNLKDQTALLEEISEKYNSFSTQQERVNFLTEIFGKSGAGLIDVFDTLAAEGGLDKTTEKVKSLGLAIDPGRYEQFTRNLEEVKLAALGLAVQFTEAVMPAFDRVSRWWVDRGLPAFQSLKKWLDTNIPPAVEFVRKTFDRLGISWNTTFKPALDQLTLAWRNLQDILNRISPSTDGVAGKFTALGAVIRIVVGLGAMVAGALNLMTAGLQVLNSVLSTAIGLWDRFAGAARSASSAAAGVSTSVPSFPRSSGSTSTGTTGGGVRRGRANSGDLMRGVSSNINERKQEVFLPGMTGSVRSGLDINVKFSNNELDRIGRSMARSLKPVLQRAMV